MAESFHSLTDLYNVSTGFSNAPLYVKAYICIFSTAAVIGTIGNATVIFVIVFSRKLRQIRNAFIVSLAFADLLVSCITMPSSVIGVMEGKQWFERNYELCKFFASICAPACQISMYSMACIAMTRYYFVCRYADYVKYFTGNRTFVYLCIIWVLGFAVHLPNHVGWGEVKFGNFRLCTLDSGLQSYVYFYAVFALLTIVTTLVFYLKMYVVLRKSPASLTVILGRQNTWANLRACSNLFPKNSLITQDDPDEFPTTACFSFISDEFLIAKTTFKMFLTFFLSWSPLCTVFFVQFYVFVPVWLGLYCAMLAHCNSALNFFLYFVDNSMFYGELKRTIFRSRFNSKSNNT